MSNDNQGIINESVLTIKTTRLQAVLEIERNRIDNKIRGFLATAIFINVNAILFFIFCSQKSYIL